MASASSVGAVPPWLDGGESLLEVYLVSPELEERTQRDLQAGRGAAVSTRVGVSVRASLPLGFLESSCRCHISMMRLDIALRKWQSCLYAWENCQTPHGCSCRR
jgi:hypothetical protein